MAGGQFDWGGRLPKGNGGVQSCPQAGWKLAVRVQRHKGGLLRDKQVEQLRKQGLVTLWLRMGAPKIIGYKLPRG